MANIGPIGPQNAPLGLFPSEDAEALAMLQAMGIDPATVRAQALRANGGGRPAPIPRPVPMSQPTVTVGEPAPPVAAAPRAAVPRPPVPGGGSPAQPQVSETQALLDAMFPQESAEVGRERSARLRNQRAMGLLGVLSGNEDLARVGGQVIGEGQEEEERVRRQGEGRREASLKFSLADIAERKALEREGRGETRAEAREARQHERALELEGLREQAALERERLKGGLSPLGRLPAETQKQFYSAGRVATRTPQILSRLAEARKTTDLNKVFGADAIGIGRTAAQFGSPAIVERMQAEKAQELARKYPEAYKLRVNVMAEAGDLIHELAGSAQSITERANILEFAPSPYDDLDAIQRKLEAALERAQATQSYISSQVGMAPTSNALPFSNPAGGGAAPAPARADLGDGRAREKF